MLELRHFRSQFNVIKVNNLAFSKITDSSHLKNEIIECFLNNFTIFQKKN